MFKPKKRNKHKDNAFHIPHNLKIGQRVKITADHRAGYLCYRKSDGTLSNPTYEILSFQRNGGVLIMDEKNPNMKCLVSYMHLIPRKKEGE